MNENFIEESKESAARAIALTVVRRIFYETLWGNYSEINKGVSLNLRFSDSENEYGLEVGMGDNGRAVIRGVMPKGLLFDEDFGKIMKGFLAHEFGHIARRDHLMDGEGLMYSLYKIGRDGEVVGDIKYLPAVIREEKLMKIAMREFSRIENGADEVAVERGLGKEVCASREYCEKVNGKKVRGYYSSEELKKLMNRNV